jgi:hypothetical protein
MQQYESAESGLLHAPPTDLRNRFAVDIFEQYVLDHQ